MIHGCTIGDNALIGMGAVILTGVSIGKNCVVGAGAIVTGHTGLPDNSMLLWQAAKTVKPVSEERVAAKQASAEIYVGLKELYEGE